MLPISFRFGLLRHSAWAREVRTVLPIGPLFFGRCDWQALRKGGLSNRLFCPIERTGLR